MKYSISEENHHKGFHIVELDADGNVSIEKRGLTPARDIRTVEATMEELLMHPVSEDYVFVRLLDETPVLSPMERIRSVYPNAMHVERKHFAPSARADSTGSNQRTDRSSMSDLDLFKAFYKEVKGTDATAETEAIFKDVLENLLKGKPETPAASKEKTSITN